MSDASVPHCDECELPEYACICEDEIFHVQLSEGLMAHGPLTPSKDALLMFIGCQQEVIAELKAENAKLQARLKELAEGE
jgi:hypothetical protein